MSIIPEITLFDPLTHLISPVNPKYMNTYSVTNLLPNPLSAHDPFSFLLPLAPGLFTYTNIGEKRDKSKKMKGTVALDLSGYQGAQQKEKK